MIDEDNADENLLDPLDDTENIDPEDLAPDDEEEINFYTDEDIK